jgi:large subunit ribosomal protein L23
MALFGNKKTESAAKSAPAKKAPAAAGVKKETAKKEAPKKEAAVSMQDLYNSGPAVKAVKAGSAKPKANEAHRILVRPLITEKATHLSAVNKYVFVVSGSANKISIAQAVKALYNVTPLKVNLSNVSGKKVVKGRVKGQRSDWRKAIVTLAKGELIKIYEGV